MAQINIAGTLHNTEEIQGDALNSHVVAHADEILDSTKEKKQSEVNADVDTALADRYTKSETYSKTQLDNLITTPDVQYVTVATYSALPATGEADTIYRVASWDGSAVDAGKYSEYAWNGSAYQLLAVRSGSIDGVFDISANNLTEGQPTQYADLAAALGTNGANVPVGVRAGGMSVRFINSTSGKYEQWRLMAASWSTTVSDWQGVDETPTAGSQNLVKSGGVDKQITLSVPYLVLSEEAGEIYTYRSVCLKQGHSYRIKKTSNYSKSSNFSFTFRKAIGDSTNQQSVTLLSSADYVDFVASSDFEYIIFYNSTTTAGGTEEIMLVDKSEFLYDKINAVYNANSDVSALTSINANALGYDGEERFIGYISVPAWTVDSNRFTHKLYCVKGGDTVYIKASSFGAQYAFLKSYSTPVNGDTAPFCLNESRVVMNANEEATITAPQDAKFLYLLNNYDSVNYSPQTLTINGKDVYAAKNVFQRFSDIQTEIETAQTNIDSVNTRVDGIDALLINGYTCELAGANTSIVTFKDTIVLSHDGDVFEALVAPTMKGDAGTGLTSFGFANSGVPGNSYYAIQLSKNRVGIRATDGTWLFTSERFTESDVVKLKIEYADSKIYTYINDTLVDTYNSQKAINISSLGNGGNGTSYGFWSGTVYYVKYNNVNQLLPSKVTVTSDVVTHIKYAWENEMPPKGVLIFTYDATSPYFVFYSRVGDSNKYFSFKIQLCVDTSEIVYLKEWRLIGGNYCEYSNGAFSNLASTIDNGENEFAIHIKDKKDFTGGVHGDERIDIDNSCFAKFFSDGVLISDLSESFVMECNSFTYFQKSSLHETTDDGTTPITNHPIIAYHLKRNIFENCGFSLHNTVVFDSTQIVNECFAGLMCVAKPAATYALLPAMILTSELTGTNDFINADEKSDAIIEMWNPTNDIKVSIEGRFEQGYSESDVTNFEIWDRTTDTKYYRYNLTSKTFNADDIIRNKQEVRFT